MRSILFGVAVAVIVTGSAGAVEPQPSLVDLEQLSRSMLFPKHELQVRDVTEVMRKRFGAGVFAAQEVVGKTENTFYPMSFAAAKPFTILTDEFIRESDDYIKRSQAVSERAKGLRRVELGDGSWGYIGMEGFGPNGVLIGVTFTNAKRSSDLKIMIACGLTELIKVPGGEEYDKLFSGEKDATTAMLDITRQAVLKATQMLSNAGDHAPKMESPSARENAGPSSVGDATRESIALSKKSEITSWKLLGIVLVAVIAFVVFLRLTRGK